MFFESQRLGKIQKYSKIPIAWAPHFFNLDKQLLKKKMIFNLYCYSLASWIYSWNAPSLCKYLLFHRLLVSRQLKEAILECIHVQTSSRSVLITLQLTSASQIRGPDVLVSDFVVSYMCTKGESGW